MRGTVVKIIVSVVVLGGGVGYLLSSTAGEAFEYYKHVDEVTPDVAQWQKKPLQLHGFVVEKSVLVKPNTLEYRFQIQNNGKVVPARFTGVVPDNFKGGAEVVLKGRLAHDGFDVDPNGVMAKCPSKYQAASPAGASGS